jgi:hypothetical protein
MCLPPSHPPLCSDCLPIVYPRTWCTPTRGVPPRVIYPRTWCVHARGVPSLASVCPPLSPCFIIPLPLIPLPRPGECTTPPSLLRCRYRPPLPPQLPARRRRTPLPSGTWRALEPAPTRVLVVGGVEPLSVHVQLRRAPRIGYRNQGLAFRV